MFTKSIRSVSSVQELKKNFQKDQTGESPAQVGEAPVLVPRHFGDEKSEESNGNKSCGIKSTQVAVTGVTRPLVTRTKGRQKAGKGASFPPELEIAPVRRTVLRFYTSAAVGTRTVPQGISADGIFGALGAFSYTSTNLNCLNIAFRIRRLTIWPAAATTDNSGAEIQWTQSVSGMTRPELVDKSVPLGQYGAVTKVTSTPPKDSLAHFWQDADQSNGHMFLLYIGLAGAIIDLDIEHVEVNSVLGITMHNISVTGATPGQFYWQKLDDADGGTSIIPVGRYPNITSASE